MLSKLSSVLGAGGAIFSFIMGFFGGSDPNILKLIKLVEETQSQISRGFMALETELRQMEANAANRGVVPYVATLRQLTDKQFRDQIKFSVDEYTDPCGDDMQECSAAFTNLCESMHDVLRATFNQVPRGDPVRMKNRANQLMSLLTQSYISVQWVRAQYRLGRLTAEENKQLTSASFLA